MGEYRITCRLINKEGILSQVNISGKRYSIRKIYDMVESGEYNFYTFVMSKKANVRTGTSPLGRIFITTNPDGITENNLDELTPCKKHP
ncbi:MAG: DUF3892 domain-containing protein [Candidatus Hydrothermarchaeales archaeon]